HGLLQDVGVRPERTHQDEHERTEGERGVAPQQQLDADAPQAEARAAPSRWWAGLFRGSGRTSRRGRRERGHWVTSRRRSNRSSTMAKPKITTKINMASAEDSPIALVPPSNAVR